MNKAPVLSEEMFEGVVRELDEDLSLTETQAAHARQIISDLWDDLEPLIQQAWQETDAISYTQGVLDGGKKAAREIQAWGDEICEEHFRYNNNMYVMRKHCLKCWQSLKSKYMEGK